MKYNIYKWIHSKFTNTSTLPLNEEGIILAQFISTSLLLWIVTGSSSKLDHHQSWIITRPSSKLDHHWIIIKIGSSLDHHQSWIITGSSSSFILLSWSNGAISQFFSSHEVLQIQPFFMMVVGLASMKVFINRANLFSCWMYLYRSSPFSYSM